MKTWAFLAMVTSLTVLMASQADAQELRKSNELRVREYVAAFNDRKIDTILRMVTPDVEWLSIEGHNIAIETTGKDQLKQGMAAYFKSTPSARSELLWMELTPSRVATLEKATWKSRSGEQSQVSLAVYEFREDLISRVYYYPAERPGGDRTNP